MSLRSHALRVVESPVCTVGLQVLLVSVPAVLILSSGTAVVDPDNWWHLSTGAWMVRNRTVPHTNPFAGWAQGRPWVAYSWLYELMLSGWFRAWHLRGLIFFELVLAMAIIVALFRLLLMFQDRAWKAAAFTAIGVFVLYPIFAPRPWMFTVLFFILQWHMILRARIYGKLGRAWCIPLMYIVWANIHVQFLYGLFALGVAAAEPWIARSLGYKRQIFDEKVTLHLWEVFAASAAATLVNPYFFGVYGVIWDYIHQAKAFNYIDELQALDFRRVKDYVELLLALVTTFLMGWRRQVRPLFVILLGAAVVTAFRAERDLWFLVCAALPIAALLSAEKPKPAAQMLPWQRAMAAVLALLVVVVAAARIDFSEAKLQSMVDQIYPSRACEFIARNGLSGPVFNSLGWGGYLNWRLPQLGVVIDGRTNLYGDAHLAQTVDTWDGKAAWMFNTDLDKANLVIGDSVAPLSSILRGSNKFHIVYEDDLAVVFVRNPEAR